MISISHDELTQFSRFIHSLTGIVLDDSKGYLLESRLGPLLAETNSDSFSSLFQKVKNDISGQLQKNVIDRITTNETYFFRDNKPFELLKYKIIPDQVDRIIKANKFGSPSLRIWSAACSSGQEAYSFAIILKEMLPDIYKWNVTILGTDISETMITQASYGRYSKSEVERGLTADKIQKYFNKDELGWRVKDELRVMVNFKKGNLLEPLNGLGMFDIILCRNVAIYFSIETRKIMFERIANQLYDHGALIIGSTESLFNVTKRFENQHYHNSTFYTLKGH